MPILVVIVVIAIIIVGGYFSYLSAKKRREGLLALAAKLGLQFNPDHDRNIARGYSFLDKLRSGDNRYAFNVLSGRFKDNDIIVFDFHYETHSTDSKGHRETHHHYFSFFILNMPIIFPELKIGREGFFSKIGQALGYDDIDFESHEFSRKFCVRSKNKKFAYDFCNSQMIEYLLANDDLTIEVENNALAISFDRRLEPEQIEMNLERLMKIRSLIPNYLFDKIH
jgi:hypothetical protein